MNTPQQSPRPGRRTALLVGAAFAAAVVVAGIVAAVVVSSTGDDSSAAAPPPMTTRPIAIATSPATDSPARSQRGNLVKHVGESAGVGRPGEPPVAEWTVTNIAVDEPCTSSIAQPPVNGHFVTLTVEAQTAPNFTTDAIPGGFHPGNNWSIVAADGVTQPHADSTPAFRCRDTNDFPAFLAPGSRYKFHLVFDSRTPTGVLTFVPTPGAAGWEWPF